MRKNIFILLGVAAAFTLASCNKYLNVVPDDVATIDNAFALRSTAEKFLFTCYSYMPSQASMGGNPAFFGGDELWLVPTSSSAPWEIARGDQRVVDPYCNYWQGTQGGSDLYEGIRQCNILLDNIERVPDMQESEKQRWSAEAKFLKADYCFWLVRMYGPIVLIKKNLPVSASSEEVRIARSPVDSCFSYIVQLLDEAAPYLPDRIENEASELGRVTKAIDLSVKALVLVTAASPLFNGNNDYKGFANEDGTPLFNTTFEPSKWQAAADACKKAIDLCQSLGYHLYHYQPTLTQYALSDTTITKMSIRNAVCEKWNSEIIWGNTNSMADQGGIQGSATPRGLDPTKTDNRGTRGSIAPPLKIAEMFYTNHGLPITEDKDWDYAGRFKLQVAGAANKYNLKEGYTTAELNFDREPRFYADLGFDGGIWFGQGVYDDKSPDLLYVSAKKGQPAAEIVASAYSTTGYWPKKVVNFQNIIGSGNTYTVQAYPWPVMRLSGLYLLYAEALNEVGGPTAEVYQYIDTVRARAGIPSVEESWSQYAKDPGAYKTKDGMRQIIHTERLIELAFEGKRFWDLRRWKEAISELNQPITGWDLDQATAEGYYRERVIFNQTFSTKDYLWPINENALLANDKLVQNPGW
jgi:hypothetical protein